MPTAPDTDPKAALGGTLLPIVCQGGALALMIEIFAAAVTAARSLGASSFFDDKAGRRTWATC